MRTEEEGYLERKGPDGLDATALGDLLFSTPFIGEKGLIKRTLPPHFSHLGDQCDIIKPFQVQYGILQLLSYPPVSISPSVNISHLALIQSFDNKRSVVYDVPTSSATVSPSAKSHQHAGVPTALLVEFRIPSALHFTD